MDGKDLTGKDIDPSAGVVQVELRIPVRQATRSAKGRYSVDFPGGKFAYYTPEDLRRHFRPAEGKAGDIDAAAAWVVSCVDEILAEDPSMDWPGARPVRMMFPWAALLELRRAYRGEETDATHPAARRPPLEMLLRTTPSSDARPNRNTGFNAWQGKKSREEKARLKRDTIVTASSVLSSDAWKDIPRPLFPANARVSLEVGWEKKATKSGLLRYRQKVDGHDTLPQMCKGIVDGLTEAGILEDDRDILASYTQVKDPAGEGYVRIRVEERTE